MSVIRRRSVRNGVHYLNFRVVIISGNINWRRKRERERERERGREKERERNHWSLSNVKENFTSLWRIKWRFFFSCCLEGRNRRTLGWRKAECVEKKWAGNRKLFSSAVCDDKAMRNIEQAAAICRFSFFRFTFLFSFFYYTRRVDIHFRVYEIRSMMTVSVSFPVRSPPLLWTVTVNILSHIQYCLHVTRTRQAVHIYAVCFLLGNSPASEF